ncbi:MAG: hypothetical protein ABGX83_05215 [Nitrospira sp.]
MILGDLIEEARDLLDDQENNLWEDRELVHYAQDVLDVFCRKTKIIIDKHTVAEILSTGKVQVTGSAGSIDSVTVNGITITSAAVPFLTSTTITATNLAANITAFSSTPNYTATSSGDTVTISAVALTGSNPNRFIVATTLSGGMSTTNTDMVGGSSIGKMWVVPGVLYYDLDPRVIYIKRAKMSLETWPMIKRTEDWMDAYRPHWDDIVTPATPGVPRVIVTGGSTDQIAIWPLILTADAMNVTVNRTTLTPLTYKDMNATVELRESYIRLLLPGILSKAYMKQHFGNAVDKRKAQENKAEFDANVSRVELEELSRNRTFATATPNVREGQRQGFYGTRSEVV